MKKTILLTAIGYLFCTYAGFSQVFSDSVFINIQGSLGKLQSENENLKSRLEMQSRSLTDISKNQSISDKTKWEKIRTNLVKSAEVYKILSEDIIDLKSQVINQDPMYSALI
eukprot:Opistho-1_new@72411